MSAFVSGLVQQLQDVPSQNNDFPFYDLRDPSDRGLIVSRCTPQSFHLGTGASLFTNLLIPAITSAASEIILVTCFWAPSKTLAALSDALAKLAAHRCRLVVEARSTGNSPPEPLRVRICFSSRSLLQKLLHPQSRHGYLYPPDAFSRDLGLPDARLLEAASIELRVKTLFFLPFSVMHPKFIIVDRNRAFVPSCNVSWEPWLEGCLELTGDAVTGLMSFYTRTWDPELDIQTPLSSQPSSAPPFRFQDASLVEVSSSAYRRLALPASGAPLPTFILPSSHHRNPQFRFPWQRAAAVPRTPLNVALIHLFQGAHHSIFVQTPNLTCKPVIDAMLGAISTGVSVTIVTNRRMMVLEQLATAGTTTDWCVRSLVRRFRQLQRNSVAHDVELGSRNLGSLCVSTFHPRKRMKSGAREAQPLTASFPEEEPVHSHLKLAVVDSELTMLGSGNMDRAVSCSPVF